MNNMQQPPSTINLPKPVDSVQPTGSRIADSNIGNSSEAKSVQPPAANTPVAARVKEGEVLSHHWINSVESLMAHGANDPAELSQQFSELKAQYISERFGKEVKQAHGKDT